jgi:cytidine deaminase
MMNQPEPSSRFDQAALVQAARAARERAYAPYSRFAVGAAVLTADGSLFSGCNVENAAYPATICAERVALAVVADTSGPVSPCGTCRQVIHELAPRATVVLANMAGALHTTTPAALLPDGFVAAELPY